MMIRDMFADDINRSINGVIQVAQDEADLIEQEVREYVITKELKKHFTNFFNYYSDSFDTPTDSVGVWISGFFGSGKSHFLKMLSYILANKTINGVKTVELFRDKFLDDPGTFMLIDKATRYVTETILFNIDEQGSIEKNNTVVLRVFAKMFYNHLGFYGENLKVALLEQYIDQQGKTAEFRRVFEEKKGKPWTEVRRAFAFNGKAIVPTLMEVLDMSEADAQDWFKDKNAVDFSIAQLVDDMKAYLATKPDNFRLLFMIDEVGQYVGTDTNLLLNLQSLVEKIGSTCAGRIWVICTGQEAIDEIIKVRADEFSRIQARFKTRLSLTSSSVDEVIQKRILKKKPEAAATLENLYTKNDSVLRNLFTFTESVSDINGYSGPIDFAENFPFVPYQFIIMQKVFAEIRKHGNSGKHLSGGERSMISGFQEAAQRVQESDEYTVVPFYCFYDTVHTFLDSAIRRVIERCERAAADNNGIEARDVDVLKLLYLIRYIDQDIPANLDNITILMAKDIRVDKIEQRGKITESLNRLLSQNYIGRTGDTYNFLTDEEQDIQREIKATSIDTAAIVGRIAQMIFGDIYTAKKYRYGKYDFAFDQMVDTTTVGSITGGMKLRFLTVASDIDATQKLRLMTESKGAAIVMLAETPYYELLEGSMKIRKYVKQRNVAQLAKSVQKIIAEQQDEAAKYEESAREKLEEAIAAAAFYVDGEQPEIRSGSAVAKIEQAMGYLVAHVYSELDLIDNHAESDADIMAILNGTNASFSGMQPNLGAAAKIEEYLEMQSARHLPTSMFDIQSKYQAIPYGWKEIDIAAVTALLIYQQKVTIKYGGTTIQPDNNRLIDMLRKKSEVGKTSISKRQIVSVSNMKAIKVMLREYFDVMDVPDDEDKLIAFIVDKFTSQLEHYEALSARYAGHKYPDHDKLFSAIDLMKDVLSQKNDNIALVQRVLKNEDKLFDNKEDLQGVEGFFASQVTTFDAAVKLEESLRNDLTYLQQEPDAEKALGQIRAITMSAMDSRTIYRRIPELNDLMTAVQAGHDNLLAKKRDELLEIVRQCMEEIHTKAGYDIATKAISQSADNYFSQCKTKIAELNEIALLDGMMVQMWNYKDQCVGRIEKLKQPPKPAAPKIAESPKPYTPATPVQRKHIKTVYRQSVFPLRTLESKEDVDTYVEKMREYLNAMLKDCDGIKLS